jgi:2-keto-4-pentenoate hydratase/2-oxohepta-3-ene-1,7-dioic acid hydratase in catechol pathway
LHPYRFLPVLSKRDARPYVSTLPTRSSGHSLTKLLTYETAQLRDYPLRKLANLPKMAVNGNKAAPAISLTNYCAFIDQRGLERIGHLDGASQTIQPLAFKSGTHLSDLYQVIQVGEEEIIPSGDSVSRDSVRLLPPINHRDILCVGKNYAEHAKEFHKSGFDSSDKTDQPTHPVIFSKRFSSIIGDGDEIYPHPKFTDTIDYEGELGVIIGKQGFRIPENEVMDYVWGYTIINDMTARERQRDHKQFYIGKSPDTFCPMVNHPPFAIHHKS